MLTKWTIPVKDFFLYSFSFLPGSFQFLPLSFQLAFQLAFQVPSIILSDSFQFPFRFLPVSLRISLPASFQVPFHDPGDARGARWNVSVYSKTLTNIFPILLKHNDNFPLPIRADAINSHSAPRYWRTPDNDDKHNDKYRQISVQMFQTLLTLWRILMQLLYWWSEEVPSCYLLSLSKRPNTLS